MTMKSISAAEFKSKCLKILDNVSQEGIVITKHGKPVAKLIPCSSEHGALIGSLKGKIKIKGDILSTGIKWNVKP